MLITEFISKQEPERQDILSKINAIIINADKSIKTRVGKMMGKEMILYEASGIFKYGLSSVKNHMSLHLMPIYGSPKLHTKFEKLLFNAKFQKGCINFKVDSDMPLNIVSELINDCAKIDFAEIRDNLKKNP